MEISVQTHISFKDFLNFNFKNSLPRTVLFSSIILFIIWLNLYNSEEENQDIFKSVWFWFLVLIPFVFLRTFFSLKNAFYSNRKIQKEIIYSFTEEKISTKGETFDGDFTWDTVYKVRETNDWFLMYQSKTVMNMIPKKYFTKQQILDLRILIKNSGVKAKLKNG